MHANKQAKNMFASLRGN